MHTTDAPPSPEELAALEALFSGMDRYFSESEERRRFMRSANGLGEIDLQLLQAALAGKLTPETAPEDAASADNPLRMANALLELETSIKKSKDKVLLDFIFALLRSPRVARDLDRLWFVPWEQALVQNKLLTPDQLRFIWQSKKETYAKELVPDSTRFLAQHSQCPADILEEMLNPDDALLRKIIAMHPNTSAELTRFFLNSPRKPERLNLAMSRHASSDVLLSLLRDKHDEVSRAAKKNLAQRFAALQTTDTAIDAAIATHIAKPYIKPANPKPEFNPWKAAQAGHDEILAMDSGQRKRVADATTDAALLSLLSTDSSKAVRRAMAKRGYCDLDVLKVLAKDPDTETSNNALRGIFKEAPHAVAEDLLSTEAVDAAYRQIAAHVAQHSHRFYSDEKYSVQDKQNFAQAMLVAEHTNNPMIQRMLVKDLQAIPETHTARWELLACASANRHLSETVSRKIIVDLGFGGFKPIQRCNSVALLKELLQPGVIQPHNHSTVQARLAELVAAEAMESTQST